MSDYTTAMNHLHKYLLDMSQDPVKAKSQLFELIRVCIEEEREACAKASEEEGPCCLSQGCHEEIAKKIRSRR